MKKILFILLFACTLCNGQTLYSWYNATNKDFLFSEFADAYPACDTIVVGVDTIQRCATRALVTNSWAKPRFDPVNQVFYNAASVTEQEKYLAEKAANAVDPSATSATNPALLTPKTDAELNILYPQPAPFWLFCENIEGGIIYIKGSQGWRKVTTYSNNN
jgi:hypothetical protein